jgi:hypothetical protein
MSTFACIAEADDTIDGNQSFLDGVEGRLREAGAVKARAFSNPTRGAVHVRFDVEAADRAEASLTAHRILEPGTQLAALGGGGWRILAIV